MRIAISPDENPGDPGSVAADGTTERSVNLRVASALLAALQRSGQDAWFDPSITYQDRVEKANNDGTAVLVACAHNESTPGVSGTQFVFCPGGGLTFGKQAQAASAVYAELSKIPGWPGRRADAQEDVWECCGFDRDTVYIEYLCMSQPDEALWSRPDYPVLAAEATARALAGVYGFAYVAPGPQPPPPPPWEPVPTTRAEHWWGSYVVGADQVVELPAQCYAPVFQPGVGHWFRNMTIIGVPQAGEYAKWTLANRVGGVWYVMDESGGPQGQGPDGRLPVEQSYWIDDSVVDDAGCGSDWPPGVAQARGGHWWSI